MKTYADWLDGLNLPSTTLGLYVVGLFTFCAIVVYLGPMSVLFMVGSMSVWIWYALAYMGTQ